jgi:electron transport complex protein RnfA
MDTVQTLLLGFIGIVIVNNLVFTKFLGICPYLGVSGRIDMAFGMGCAVTFVVTLAGTLTWIIDHVFLIDTPLEVMRYLCFILVIAGAVQLVEMYVRKFFPPLYESFGVFLPLITTNCAILGLCLFVNLWGIDNLLEAVVLSVGAGIGSDHAGEGGAVDTGIHGVCGNDTVNKLNTDSKDVTPASEPGSSAYRLDAGSSPA